MSKIYLPTEYLNKPCVVVNNGYLRVYETINNSYSNKVYDIYLNQDYMVKETTANYNSNVACVNKSNLTDEIYYRVDFSNILITFFILSIICFYLPWKLMICRLIRKWN